MSDNIRLIQDLYDAYRAGDFEDAVEIDIANQTLVRAIDPHVNPATSENLAPVSRDTRDI